MLDSGRLLDRARDAEHRFAVKQRFVALRHISAVALLGAIAACGSGGQGEDSSELARGTQAFVNGEDDRLDYFELTDERLRGGMARSTVALTADSLSRLIAEGDTSRIRTWGETDALCADQPFADQPAAVFCSGVLVDWDLVLTSGHCVDVIPNSSLRVMFGYYYQSEGDLAVSADSVYRVREVITSRNDRTGTERLDFAWLRLTESVRPPYHPSPIYLHSPGVEVGDPIINVSAGGGVPLKFDGGGRVQNVRAGVADYFVADTDTSQGSSGSPAFDDDFSVVGSLARGAPDFLLSEQGCRVTAQSLDPADAIEEFTFAHRAVEALCEAGAESALCSADCGEPCDASTAPRPARLMEDDGCSLGPKGVRGGYGATLLAAALVALIRRRGVARARHAPWR